MVLIAAIALLPVGTAGARKRDRRSHRLGDLPIGPEGNRYVSDAALQPLLDEEVAEYARFFDPYVRGVGAPVNPLGRAKWHLGHVGYFETEDWPPRGRELREFFLASGESAARGGGTLADRPDTQSVAVHWVHDPADPVPSQTETDDVFLLLAAYPDLSCLADRPDVLTFTSEELHAPIDIVGSPRVEVRVGSTAPTMQVYVRLQDVEPDGRANLISGWQVTISDPDPGQFVQIDLNPLAYRMRTGHRLRLQFASSDYPYFLVHPGTAENPWFTSTRVANEQTLVTGGTSPSRLELPVLPALPERTGRAVG